ncbi:MAG TPA: c-type cytochrome [Pyrinomonadaceae bacterium]|jgi:cytochrome c1
MRKKSYRLKLLAASLLLGACAAACGGGMSEAERAAAEMTGGGDPARGRSAIERYGCGTCHTIPGVRGADALVGPPLSQAASRSYVGGVLTNSPENMMRWIRDPRAVDNLTAMPTLGVTDRDARDITSYLYTLK